LYNKISTGESETSSSNGAIVYTVNLGLVSMNYIFHERNLVYLHGKDKVRSKINMCPQRIFVFHVPKYVDQM